MPITGSNKTVIAHDNERGGTWVVRETAFLLGDTKRYRDLARRFPNTYRVGYTWGGIPQLEKREILIGSPSASRQRQKRQELTSR